jgi:general stress protein YciG
LTYFLKISKSDRKVKNYNPNYTNVSEFANNTNKNKIQNAKISSEGGSSSGGKMQNDNLKLKISKFKRLSLRVPKFRDEAISKINYEF